MIFGWESNKTMVRKYLTEHAEDMGRFWAEMALKSPMIYLSFISGFYQGLMENNEKKEDK